MTEGNLTHRDLARLLGVSETTVKSYRRKFPDCIPVASQGKPIRFTADAAAVSLRIRDLFEMGMSVEEVRTRLATEFAWISAEAPEQPADTVDDTPVAPVQPARVELPQDFTLAVSNLAKSMVGLTQQQNAILKRVQNVETLLSAHAAPAADAATGAARPAWLDEAQALAARFEALLHSLRDGTPSLPAAPVASTNTGFTPADAQPRPDAERAVHPAEHAGQAEQTEQTEQAELAELAERAELAAQPNGQARPAGRVVPFPGGAAAAPGTGGMPGQPDLAPGMGAPQELPRHLLALPLVVQSPQGEFLGVAGRSRGRFCVNDLKAMLAFAFQPPDHYALRGEPAEGGGWWLTLEQPQASTPYDVVLLVEESVTPRGNQVTVVRRYIANGVEAHPTEIYGFLRAVQG